MLPYINTPFEYVSDIVGASVDELKLLFLFIISYPLAALLKRIPDGHPWQKNVFSIGISLFYLIGLFDLWSGFRTLVINASVIYLIAKYIEGPFMPWIGFVYLMAHMSVNHVIRQAANSPSVVDISGAQMVLVMKLSAFCWNVHDGRLPDSDLTPLQKERAIRQLPSVLDYAGYVFFFPALMVGPAFDYADYGNYITTNMFELPPDLDPSKAPPTRKKRRIPRSGRISTWKLAEGLVWIAAFLQFSAYYYPKFYLSEDWMRYNFVRRVFHLYMLGLVSRMKYYGVWTMTEGACILSGIGYRGIDPKTGRPAWDRLTNVKPWDLETAQNTHAYIGNWNINTNLWLRNYVYLRVTPKGKKPGFRATLATFFTSAFWHGFYPGYYLTFVLGSFLQTISKNARRLIRPFFLTPDGQKPTGLKIYYDIACWVITQTAFAFTVAPFVLLTVGDSFKVWSRVYFYCIIGAALCVGFLASPAKGLVVKRLKAYQKPGLNRTESRDSVERAPTLGVPDDPEQTIDEIVTEVKLEIQRRKKDGIDIPDVRELIRDKLEDLRPPQLKKVIQSQETSVKSVPEHATDVAQVQVGEGKKQL